MTDVFADVRAAAAKKYDAHHWSWAQQEDMGSFPMAFHVKGFTGREMLADEAGTIAAARAWAAYGGPGTMQTTVRRWAGYGAIPVPRLIAFHNPSDLALFADRGKHWSVVTRRVAELRLDWPGVLLPRGVFTRVSRLSDDDWWLVLPVLRWADTADVAQRLARELPVPGADTKWVESHWGLVEELAAAGGRSSAIPMDKLRRVETMTTVGFLDPMLRATVGGMRIFAAAPSELAQLQVAPATVIICENLQNIHAFTDIPGAVVLAGKGFDVQAHARIPWVHGARVLYWGDIDTHGFEILNRLRHHMEAESILMDRRTLLANKMSWAQEDKPKRAALTKLTSEEQDVYESLVAGDHGDRVRFEQERVPWPAVIEALRAAGVPVD